MNLFFGALLNFIFNGIITHIPFHWLRKNFLRLFNKNIDNSVVILMHVHILNFWKIRIHERVVINQYCLLDCRQYSITIGHDTDIGPYSKIWTLEHDPNDANHSLKGGDVVIEDHVWVASSVNILPGVKISKGAILATSSLVTKDVNSLEIIGGVPGKVIGKRKNELNYTLKYTPLFD